MNLTPNQEAQIRQTLRGLLKYKDTYDEVYDHILSSLAILPDYAHFKGALNNIIENELGGSKGIKAIEAKYRKLAIKQFIKDYFAIAAGCLTSITAPLIILTVVVFYLLTRNLKYNNLWFTAVETIVGLIPSITQGVMIVKKRVLGNNNVKVTPEYMADARTWIQSVNVGWLGMAVILIDAVSKAVFSLAGNSLKLNLGVYPLTLLFFIAMVHSITYYRLFKDMPMKSWSN
jgi:hypothetical protein